MELISKQNLTIEQKEEYKRLFRTWIKKEDRLQIAQKMGLSNSTVYLYLNKLVGSELVFNYALEIAKKREAEYMQELHKINSNQEI